MNLQIIVEDITNTIDVHGGGYAINDLNIYLDKSLDLRQCRNLVINEVVEAFCRPWHKETVDELVEYICEALDETEVQHGKFHPI